MKKYNRGFTLIELKDGFQCYYLEGNSSRNPKIFPVGYQSKEHDEHSSISEKETHKIIIKIKNTRSQNKRPVHNHAGSEFEDTLTIQRSKEKKYRFYPEEVFRFKRYL